MRTSRLFQIGGLLALLFLGIRPHIFAQGIGCDALSFSLTPLPGGCCYRLSCDNATPDDCFGVITLNLDPAIFTNFAPGAGWHWNQAAPNEINVRPSIGFISSGASNIATFCVTGGPNASLTLLYDNLCLMEGCAEVFNVNACPYPGKIEGKKYVDIGCRGEGLNDQPVLANWEFELYDADNNFVESATTNAAGLYRFADLPYGIYIVRELPVGGWQSSLPLNGEAQVELTVAEPTATQDFGNCPTTCACDSIYVNVTQQQGTSDTSTYYLNINNHGQYCFQYVNVKVIAGALVNWTALLPGWEAAPLGPNEFQISPPGPLLPGGGSAPISFRVRGAGDQLISVTTFYSTGGDDVECKRQFGFSSPPVPLSTNCCPLGSMQGAELVIDGDFVFGATQFNFPGYKVDCNPPGSMQGDICVTTGNAVPTLNSNWACQSKSGNPNDEFLTVDGAALAAPGVRCWAQVLGPNDVTAGQQYALCAWFNNLVLPSLAATHNNPHIELGITSNSGFNYPIFSQTLTGPGLDELPDAWVLLQGLWTAPTGANFDPPYTIYIRNRSAGQPGNDFAVDCISFKSCMSLPSCTPNFTFNIGSDCRTVNFTNTSTGTGLNYTWNFGDGSPTFSGQTPPPHVYTNCNQTYQVTLTISGSNCPTTSVTKPVTITDNTPPTITNCPPAKIVAAPSGIAGCPIALAIPTVTANDNCPGPMVTNNAPIGGNFNGGTTNVTFTATDACGNTSTCVWPVTVNCYPQFCPTCPGGATPGPNLVQNGDFELGATLFTSNYNYFSPGATSSLGTYSALSTPAQISAANQNWAGSPLGGSLMMVVNGSNGVSDMIWKYPFGLGTSMPVTANTTYLFTAFVDNLTMPSLDFTDPTLTLWVNNDLVDTEVFPEIMDGWFKICGSWNSLSATTAILTIRIVSGGATGNDFALDNISFQACTTQSCTPDFTFNAACNPVQFTNTSAGSGLSYTWNFGDNTPTLGQLNPSHVYANCNQTYQVTLTISGPNCPTTSVTKPVTVSDNTPPTITNCPQNTTVSTDAGKCYATLSPPAMNVTDNCPNPTITCTWQDPNGTILPFTAATQFPKLGISTVRCRATDACGNQSALCQYLVAVIDNQPPTITCPQNAVVAGALEANGNCKATVYGLDPVVNDNCPQWTTSYMVNNGSALAGSASGTMFSTLSTVKYTVTDCGSNTATCTFTVTVNCENCTCPNSPPTLNLIANGNFSAGNVGFTSDLTFSGSCGNGKYGVGNNTTAFGSSCYWQSNITQTTCNPPVPTFFWNFLMIDANVGITTPYAVWKSPVNLSQNTNYNFSFDWTCPLQPAAQTPFTATVVILDGSGTVLATLGSATIAGLPGTWATASMPTWNSGNINVSGPRYAAIRIHPGSGQSSSDFCLDNICFTKTTAPQGCTCGSFTNMEWQPFFGSPNHTFNCGDALIRDCLPSGLDLNFYGSFNCVGNCNTPPTATWELRELPSNNLVQGPTPLSNLSNFTFFIDWTLFTNPNGQYKLILKGTCDGVACTSCEMFLNVSPAPQPITIGATPGLNICPGQSVDLDAGGGPWTGGNCLWSNGGNGPINTVFSPGTYCVTCTDAFGCSETQCVTVTQNPAPTVNILKNPNPASICEGSSATLTATSSVPGSTFLWMPGGQTTPSITVSPTPAGSYVYTVTASANGCTGTATTTVTVKPKPGIIVTASPINLCLGASTTLTATGLGVPGTYTYAWSNPPGISGNSGVYTPTAAGLLTYLVTCTASNGCTVLGSVVVGVKSNPTVTISGNLNPCTGQSTSLTATGNPNGGTYSWNPGGANAPTNITANGTFSVTYTAPNGCTASAAATVAFQTCCGTATNCISQNGNFNSGSPGGHDMISGATNWFDIWPLNHALGAHTGDFWPAGATYGVGTPPVPPSLSGGFVCYATASKVWRRGIMNKLSTPIVQNTGCYNICFKVACSTFWNTATPAQMDVFGVPTSSLTTINVPLELDGCNNSSWPSHVDNPSLFSGNGAAIQLGSTISLSPTATTPCDHNFQTISVQYNSNGQVPANIDRVFFTRKDPPANVNCSQYGRAYVHIDDLCIEKTNQPCGTPVCDCATPTAYLFSWPNGLFKQPICNSTVNLPCFKPNQWNFIVGTFPCNLPACAPTNMTWKLTGPGLPTAGITGNYNYPFFTIILPSAYFANPGNYNLNLSQTCVTNNCSCDFKLVSPQQPCCPCGPLFTQSVGQGFAVVGGSVTNCGKIVRPLALCANDQVEWFVGGFSQGTTTGNANKTLNFNNGSGWYFVCMKVTRTDGSQVCVQWNCRRMYVSCPSNPNPWPLCTANLVGNGGFNSSSPGVLNGGGNVDDWELAPNLGSGIVVADSTGGFDTGHLIFMGQKGNQAGAMQYLQALDHDNFIQMSYNLINYLGENTPPGTVLEFRLQKEPFESDNPDEVFHTEAIGADTSSTAWTHRTFSVPFNFGNPPDPEQRYLIINLKNNSDTERSIIGLDNLEICTEPLVNTDEKPKTEREQVKIYPNPNPGQFTIELSGAAKPGTVFKISDVSGRQVMEINADAGSNRQIIHAETLPPGLYFLQVVSEGRLLAVQKFVKQ